MLLVLWNGTKKNYPFGIRTKTEVLYWYVDMGISISNNMIIVFLFCFAGHYLVCHCSGNYYIACLLCLIKRFVRLIPDKERYHDAATCIYSTLFNAMLFLPPKPHTRQGYLRNPLHLIKNILSATPKHTLMIYGDS